MYIIGTAMGHMKDSSTTQFYAAICVARWKMEPLGPASTQYVHLEMKICQPNKPVLQPR